MEQIPPPKILLSKQNFGPKKFKKTSLSKNLSTTFCQKKVWPRLAPFGPVWPQLAPFGPVWPHLAPFGPVWPRLAPFGPVWPNLAQFDPIWPCLAPFGPAWSHQVLLWPCLATFQFQFQSTLRYPFAKVLASQSNLKHTFIRFAILTLLYKFSLTIKLCKRVPLSPHLKDKYLLAAWFLFAKGNKSQLNTYNYQR